MTRIDRGSSRVNDLRASPPPGSPGAAPPEVRIIQERDGIAYRACPKCAAPLDIAAGEWVADFPDRPVHGYRISQLFSSKVDPGEILADYRSTRFPERFYNLKIGIAGVPQGTLVPDHRVRSSREHAGGDGYFCTRGNRYALD